MATFQQFKRWIIGDPLASVREKHERLNIPLALAVFASDALSSNAYATEEMIIALSVAGLSQAATLLSIPIALAIGALMCIVVMSYRQVIRCYPEGGGTYEVSKAHLGILASQVAGAALLIDYVLTVAVSVAAGVEALVSTQLIDPTLQVHLALIFVIILTLINLRGVRESGKFLAIPAFLFIGMMVAMILTGVIDTVFLGSEDIGTHYESSRKILNDSGYDWTSLAILMLMLNAFSHGCAALTGIEAVSNGVKAFKEPSSVNANRTLVIMACILGTIFLGLTYLAFAYQVGHKEGETVVSQIARHTFGGDSILYYLTQFSTMIILVLAANTSFSGFPRLATFLAQDGFLPRQLMSLGDRLVFSNGIIALGFLSAVLIVLYHAETHALIPLYAVGVFLSFTLAQAGMVFHHKRHKEPGWRAGMRINGFGAVTTAAVTLLLCYEKFAEGAWLVILAIPLIILQFRVIHAHYNSIRKQLILPETGYCPRNFNHTALVLVSSLNKGTIPALEYAKSISKDVEAVHVELNPIQTEFLKKAWDEWGCGIPLTILKSPFRSVSEPIVNYIDEVETRKENNMVTIIVPEFVTKKFWHNFLHNQTALLLKTLLRFRKGKVVTTVRYYLDE